MERVEFDYRPSFDRYAISLLAIIHLAVLALVAAAALVGAAFTNWIVLIPVLFALFISVLTFVLLFTKYQSLDVVKAKREIVRESRGIERDIARQKGFIREASTLRESIPKQRQRAIDDRQNEHDALLARLSSRRIGIANARSQEAKSKLLEIQRKHLSNGLALKQIEDARIRSISPKLKRRLTQRGIISASDIEWTAIKGIRGFNDKKIKRLAEWKNSVTKELNASKPGTLPPTIEKEIEIAYSSKRAKIDEEISSAQRALEADIDEIQRDYSTRARRANENADATEAIARGELSDLSGVSEDLSRKLQPYSAITFRNYVQDCITSIKPQRSTTGSIVLAVIPIVIFTGFCFESFIGLGASASVIANAIPTATPTATFTSTPIPSRTPTPDPSPSSSPTETMSPPTDTPIPIGTPTITSTPSMTLTPTITLTPSPTRTPDIAAELRRDIREKLSDGNRDVPRISEIQYGYLGDPGIIYVRWAINDNILESWVKGGAKRDVSDILEVVDSSNIAYGEVWVEGSFPLVDAFGNTEEEIVVRMFYDKSTVDQIVWSSFISDNVYIIADDGWIHPAFRD